VKDPRRSARLPRTLKEVATVPDREGRNGVSRREPESIGTPAMIAGYFSRIGNDALLGPEEELDLARRARAGDERAGHELVEKNLRLAVSVAKR